MKGKKPYIRKAVCKVKNKRILHLIDLFYNADKFCCFDHVFLHLQTYNSIMIVQMFSCSFFSLFVVLI